VEKLILQAQAVFPRADNGKTETDKLTEEQVDEAVESSENVIDTREMFARKVAENGGVRTMLRGLFEGDPEARERAAEFLAAEDGEKEFR
jgi:hypothetical protein